MLLGVDYYPEQWDPARMEADMDTIREMGGNTIRIAEFAWHWMEPEEAFTRPVMVRRVVDLPAPLAPISVTILPSGTSREMPRRAWMPP